MLKSRQCSNVKCSNVKNVKADYCPDCGAEVHEYGFRDGMRLISDKKEYKRKLKESVKPKYLVCGSCGGYYELKPEESPDDFDLECECGGELIYSENLEETKEYFTEPETTIKCPHCGTQNPDYANFCQECGKNPHTETTQKNELKTTNAIVNVNHMVSDSQLNRNLKGIELEKDGKVDQAIKLYEMNIKENFVGNRPYDRLAIIYRKNKQFDDEIRVLEKAIEVFEEIVSTTGRIDGPPKLKRFKERLKKAQKLQTDNSKKKKDIPTKKTPEVDDIICGISFINIEIKKIESQQRGKAKYSWKGKDLFAEEIAIKYYEKNGYEASWTENYYWWFLMALIFWDEIFAKIKGAVTVNNGGVSVEISPNDPTFDERFKFMQEMNGMPSGFFKPVFYQKRKKIIDNKIRQLKKADLETEISNSYKTNYGKNCRPIEDWDRYTLNQLIIPIKRMDKSAFLGIMERLISNFNENRRGLPDLIVYNDNELFFSEVKSEKDRVSDKQRAWHLFLAEEMQIKVDLFLVNHGKRKINNIKSSYHLK